MIPVPVETFAGWLGGVASGFPNGATVSSFALDSNQVKPGDLFMAIQGERVDGHDFVARALEGGAVGAIVERPMAGPAILVPNLVEALAKMAGHYRSHFDGPVVAITGSAGKTSTKEFVAAALSPLGPVLKTAGNRNTEFTAPLVWTDYDGNQKTAVIEMAMRGFGQIRHLADFTKPTIGLVTNIGFAHMEMVGSRQGIADAKGELLELLPADGHAVIWNEDDFAASLKSKSPAPVVSFGFEDGSDCRVLEYKPMTWSSAMVKGTCFGKPWFAELPAVGKHMALNAAAAVLVAVLAGVEAQEAAGQIRNAQLPPLRMQVIERDGATILLDTYNASPPSMIAAIETLKELAVTGRRMVVLGDMRELGAYTEDAHQEVAAVVAQAGFDRVLFYGAEMAKVAALAHAELASTLGEVEAFVNEIQPGDALLIKGSRSLELERALGEGGVH